MLKNAATIIGAQILVASRAIEKWHDSFKKAGESDCMDMYQANAIIATIEAQYACFQHLSVEADKLIEKGDKKAQYLRNICMDTQIRYESFGYEANHWAKTHGYRQPYPELN